MNRLHEGWDYKLYQVYIWGGLASLVAYLVVTVLRMETFNWQADRVFLRLIAPVIIYIAGILLYWWWVFLFKGNRDLANLGKRQEEEVPAIEALRSWNTLHQAMALSGGDVREFIRNAKRANRPILVWYGIMNLGVAWVFAPFVLGYLGVLNVETGELGGFWLGGMGVWVVLLLVATPILVGWGGNSAEQAYLGPLGLAVARTPSLKPDLIALIGGGQTLIPDGPAIVEGERRGRLVHIETIGKHSLTVVQARTPELKIQSIDGRLVPDEGTPEAVARAAKSLRKAKRWRGIAVYAGPEGIAVQRQSRGTNMWLYDLWLAEYLLDEIHGTSGLSGPAGQGND
jgi:hypothetical protein